jgi:nucleotide-binding universal stress UspA family protein
MALPRTMLYAVDFSDRCRAVWPAVAEMARRLDVPITLIHALDIEFLDELDAADLEVIRGRAKDKLDHFLAAEPGASNIGRLVAEGPAAECIVQCAAKMDAPLIMMPTRGHTRFRQLLLGSVTAAVLHDAEGPVWTDAHSENEPPRDGFYRSIVCAIDMSGRTPEVLETAFEYSTTFGAVLHIVHSVPGIDPRFPSGPADRAHRLLIQNAREDFSVHCSKSRVKAPLEIVEDLGLVNGILGAVSRHDADLLVIGRGVIKGPLGRLRTNAHEIVRRSPCPVLSI